MIEPGELLAVIRAGHYRYISEAEMRCLAYFALGYPAAEIAAAVTESVATVNRHIRRVREIAAAQVGIDLTQEVFRTWVLCHAGQCGCTAPVQELIGGAQILSGDDRLTG